MTATSTPGFFTSAFGMYNDSNPFDCEFKNAPFHGKQDQYFGNSDDDFFGFEPRHSPPPAATPKGQAGNPTIPPQDLDGMDLGSPGLWSTARQVSSLDPRIFDQGSNKTPFAPVKDSHLDPVLRQPNAWDKVLTSDLEPQAKIQHGQITPPSDATPVSESAVLDRLPHLDLSPKSATKTTCGGKRKRSSQLNPSADTGSKRRKNPPRAKSVSSEKQGDGEEVDEKRSKFLERNRIAASKCRQKKKEWTNNLEQRARDLQHHKTQLSILVASLREEMLFLKSEVLKHNSCNCTAMRDYLNREVQSISQQAQQTTAPVPDIPVSMGPPMSNEASPVMESMEVDPLDPFSQPSTRYSSMSAVSPVDDQKLKSLLTSEIQHSE